MFNEYQEIKSISNFETNKITNLELIERHRKNLNLERIKNRLILPNLEKLRENKTSIFNEKLDSNRNKKNYHYSYIKDSRRINIDFPFNKILQLRGGWKDLPSLTSKKDILTKPTQEVPKKRGTIVNIFKTLSFSLKNLVQWVIINPFLVQLNAMWGFIILIAMYRQIFSTIFILLNSLTGGTLKKISDRLFDSLIFKQLISIVDFLTNPAIKLIYSNLDSSNNYGSKISGLISDLSNKITLLETLFRALEKSLISLNENQIISEEKINECNQMIQFFLNILFQISQLQKASIFLILSETNGMKQVNEASLANQRRLEEDFQELMKTNQEELESITIAFSPIRAELALLRESIDTESQVNYKVMTGFRYSLTSINENLSKIKVKSSTFAYNQNQLLEAFKVFSNLYQSLNKHYSINQESLNSVMQNINSIEIEMEETSVNPSRDLQGSNSESIFESTIENLKTNLKLIYASFTMSFSTQVSIGVENTEKSIIHEKKN